MKSRFLAYGCAVAADALAALVAFLLWPGIERGVSAPFFAAVMVAAWYGGLGPGLVAAALAIPTIEYFFSPPFYAIVFTVEDSVRVAVFLFVALLISALHSGRRRAEGSLRAAHADLERHVQERTRELSNAKVSLESQIAERVKAQEAEHRLASIVESMDDAVIGLTLDGVIINWNPAAERMYGYSTREAIGQPWTMSVPAERHGELEGLLETLKRGGPAAHLETMRVTKSGVGITVSLTVSPIRDASGRLEGVSMVARDITLQKRAEQRFRLQSAALFAAADGMVITDREGIALWVNPAFTSLSGYSAAEMIGQNMRLLKSGKHDRPFYENLWWTILAGQVWRGEIINRRKDGSIYSEEQTITPVRGEDGEIGYFISVKHDVTQRKRLQEELIQSEKLATLGELVAGIAHELNNPLTAMMGHAQLLRMGQHDPAVTARVQRIMDAAQRSKRIVQNFLTVARRHQPERVRVSVNEVVRNTLELLAYQLRVNNIEVEATLASEVPIIAGDPHQLQQVILNLANNAVQAMTAAHGRGQLRVVSRFEADGGSIEIMVGDDGPGIAREDQPRIFEPFFTTKPAGQGTGLGLAVVKAIVVDHGGTIKVESVLGEGATFVVTLPVTTPPGAAAERAPARAIPAGLRVLVVDDEASLRELMAEALAMQGAQVETARDGHEALQVLGRTPVDVLVLDIHMPGMSGTELWEKLQKANPALARRTVFCTGSIVNESTRSFLRATECPVVIKPFEWPQLFDAIAEALTR